MHKQQFERDRDDVIDILTSEDKDINDVISIPLKLLFVHSLPNAKTKMASDWFVNLSEVDLKSVSKEQENVKTKKKT